jgi:hypothetical protein
MFCPPFPEREPEITITPCPEAELREVRRVDVPPYVGLVLCPGAEGYEASYHRYPEGEGPVIWEMWVPGIRRHRGRVCLEVLYRYLTDPARGTWGRELYRVTPDQITTVYSQRPLFYEGDGGDFSAGGGYVKDDIPELRALRVGEQWQATLEDGDIRHSQVEGPFTLTSPAGAWPCLRLVEWYTDERSPEGAVLSEWYVAESGRTLMRRSFTSQASLESRSSKRTRSLLSGPRMEHHGVTYFLGLSCFPDFVLGIKTPDTRWPQYVDKWPPRPRSGGPSRKGRKPSE